MKLAYFRDPRGNFGDDLNAWLWDRVAPGFVNDDSGTVLLGIGTLLGRWFTDTLPEHKQIVSVGTGSGEKGMLPVIDGTWKIYGVRGPLTAAYFGLTPDYVTADPAILIHEMTDLYSTSGRSGIGFMPHVWSTEMWDWRALCDELGIIYIDPHGDSIGTIAKIGGLDRLVTEAMHGAIVADALRVPWVACRVSRRFASAKWCDWAAALGIDLKIHPLHELRQPRSASAAASLRRTAKYWIAAAGFPAGHLELRNTGRIDKQIAKREMILLARTAPAQLSSDRQLAAGIDRVKAALMRAQDDKLHGHTQ